MVAYNQKFIDTDGSGSTFMMGVEGAMKIVDVTLACDTAEVATGDLISDSVEVDAAVSQGGYALLKSLAIISLDDVAFTGEIYFWDATTDMGTTNSAVAVADDANLDNYLGHVACASADFIDIGPGVVACYKNIDLVLKAASGDSIFVGLVGRDTYTFTATGIKLRLGLVFP